MADLYSTDTLSGVVQNLATTKPPRTFLRDRYFTTVQTDNTSETINFDRANDKPRISPFVSPLVAGKVVDSAGFYTDTFKPAYVKDKRRLGPGGPLKRSIGEPISGNLDPMERRRLQIRTEQQDQLNMNVRRQEVMCAEVLRTGKQVVSGEGFPTTQVDFLRDAALTITLAGAAKWDQTGVKVLRNIQDWATLIQDTSGAVSTDVVMHPGVWTYIQDRLVEQGLDISLLGALRSGTSNAEMGPLGPTLTRARPVGTLGDFEFWTYNDKYQDETGAMQDLIPTGGVMLLGQDIEGVRAFGMIHDEEAEYRAEEYFAKSWLEKDPAVRWLLLQSAPLMVPYRPNATLYAKVF